MVPLPYDTVADCMVQLPYGTVADYDAVTVLRREWLSDTESVWCSDRMTQYCDAMIVRHRRWLSDRVCVVQ